MATPTLTALIVDDEPLARQELAYLLERAGGVSIVGEGTNGIEAVDLIRTHRPDVVFLDVRMPGLDGFAVLRKLLSSDPQAQLPQVVFATAFDRYAVKAFEVNAVDYLLKPFDSKRLAKTLDKLRSRTHSVEPSAPLPQDAPSSHHAPAAEASSEWPIAAQPLGRELPRTNGLGEASPEDVGRQFSGSRLWDAAQAKLDTLLRMLEEQALGTAPTAVPTPARTGRVVLRLGDRLMLVDQNDVCFAYTEEGRIRVVTKTLEGDSNVRTLEELAEQLDPAKFWRAHRSYLVNLQHIREVMPWFRSSYKLSMDDRKATEIPVSRAKTERLRELFNL